LQPCQNDAAELAAAGGALGTPVLAQRWNEAGRTWLQRRIGASSYRRTREEVTVRAGAATQWPHSCGAVSVPRSAPGYRFTQQHPP
jgi:hypothetical protein